ncbi:hypothetical protein LJR231_002666 [Phyllobacterium sp. LjRoot231]|uniref:hypothetical protein n=1 Tax=Phyllobacterium sp. LjRoot231 TaxID=3342289 RepID=UPI003ECE61FD
MSTKQEKRHAKSAGKTASMPQVAALAYRIGDDGQVEILLTRRTKRNSLRGEIHWFRYRGRWSSGLFLYGHAQCVVYPVLPA